MLGIHELMVLFWLTSLVVSTLEAPPQQSRDGTEDQQARDEND